VRITYRKEEIADVHSNINSNTDVREVEAITQPDQGERNEVMHDQLLEVLARFLQH
jgi:hypothetical protein